MREPIRDKGRLEHMLDAITHVETYTKGLDKNQLVESPLHLHATVYNIQVVGEAVYKLTSEFKDTHPDTPWKVIEKMRHILVHDYYQVNHDVLWVVITEDLPLLKQQIIQYISDFE